MNNDILVPGFRYDLIDRSFTPVIEVKETPEPLFLIAFSADKGPENMRIVSAANFFKLYGERDTNYFEKHGQPLLQAATIAEHGAKLLVKRVVADDAKLANMTIIAKVSKEEVQKTDAEGKPLYTDKSTGQETTTADGNTAIMVQTCTIKYDQVSVENVKDLPSIITELESKHKKESIFPIFTITDIGRGNSNKRFRITPNYNDSKYKTYMKYNIEIIENSKIVETIPFTIDPNVVEANINRALDNVVKLYSNQIVAKVHNEHMQSFIEEVAKASGNDIEYCAGHDLFFGKERRATDLKNIKVDISEDTGNLSYVYGILLTNGDNGSFGTKPFGTESYKEQLVKFFGGEFDESIYDLDNYKIDLLTDANYPTEVKREIEKLTDFREDFSYLRDLGLGLNNMEDIKAAHSKCLRSKFCTTYPISYDIIDPYTKKQITVTMTYTLSKLLIDHFLNGRARPFAGEGNSIILSDAIEGTVSFIPKVTPKYNQKIELLEDRLNYATYFDGKLILETLMTSQDNQTELSYIHNIFAIQHMIKDVRTKCPKMRYRFIDGNDLVRYKEDVEAILRKHIGNFKSLKLVYLNDDSMIGNKVFYAALEVRFRAFVQQEYFKIYALR